MGRPKYDDADFLDAALAIAALSGPAAVTIGAITDRLKAPVGSFYHRFASRDGLLGELWLRTVLDFQQGIDQPGMRLILKILERDDRWIMLSNGHRGSATGHPWDDAVPFG